MRKRDRSPVDDADPVTEPLGHGRLAKGMVMYAGFARNGRKFLVGDFIHLKAPDARTPPYVALLEHVFTRTRETPAALWCEVRWFYRPEDVVGGRQPEHGQVRGPRAPVSAPNLARQKN